MKRSLTVVIVLIIFGMSSFGQSVPTSSGELAYRLVSPFYLGGGAHITRTETPQGTFLNPAMAAGFQRTILDLNYANLQGLGSGATGMGHAANISMAVPTRAGVFTGSLGLLETSAYARTPMDLGTSGHLNLAFSKEIYSDMWFGVGFTGDLGEIDGAIESGAALNVGYLHFPEIIWGLDNFSWGLTLTGLGYRFASTGRGYLDSIPGNITPAVGLAFDIVNHGKFRWTFRSDARLPSVTDLWFGVAGDFHLGRLVRLSVSSSITVRDAIAGSWQTVIPSAALGLNFALGGSRMDEADRFRTTEMDIQFAAAPLYDGVWGFSGGGMLPFGVRDTEPPKIHVDHDGPQYISPNYDGTQDELLLPYQVTDQRYITGYRWRVADAEGAVVRTYLNKDERPENESVKNLWHRLLRPKEGTPMPESFRWDGVTDAGALAPDGEYEVRMEFRDDNNNVGVAGPFAVVVDTVPPDLDLENPEGLDLIFSPDADGLKDRFTVDQDGSVEHLWEAGFQNSAGAAVKVWAWADEAPPDFEWDGRNDSGEVVEDGVYRYVVESTDRAGNSNSGAIEGIIIDTLRPEIGLTIDKRIFSPGTDSPVSTLTLNPEIPVQNGIVDWTLDLVAADGTTVKTWSRRQTPAIPDSFLFDGNDDTGRRLAEGEYLGRLSIEYGNGFRPEATSPGFVVDVTPPKATVSANWTLFSPQGESRRDRVTFAQQSTDEERWVGTLTDSPGETVKSWNWIATAPESLVWDGRDAEGRLVPDGEYRYTLSAVDAAGNRGASLPVTVTVDMSAVEASLTASLDVFGPTGNGTRETVSFFTNSRTDSPVADWSLEVKDEADAEIRRWTGEGSLPDRIIWDGRNDAGAVAPDGSYTGALTVSYMKGDVAQAVTGVLRLDTAAPEIEVQIAEPLFSPDGDGWKDTVSLRQNSSVEHSFEARIVDAQNQTVRRWVWNETLDSFEWDGTDDSGNPLPDGDYRYTVSGVDLAGNRTEREIPGLRIDTAPTPVYLTAKEGYIKAGEVELERMQSFTVLVPNDSGVLSWSFAVENEEGKAVYAESGPGEVPEAFRWNGTNRDGRAVEGVFKGALTLVYAKGARPRAETRPFVSDGSPPELSVGLEPQPFSPDGDNVDDEVIIALLVEDRSRIREWSLEIFDPRDNEFITFSGRGRPSERIIWDGRSGRGELVESAEDYPYLLTVTDALDHRSVKRGSIPVDVLVIREGSRLKIQINNITFHPSSSRLTLTGEEGKKNIEVLNRLAEIMQKYASYRIVVEGHAVSLNWANPAAAEREQRDILVPLSHSRAQTVVDELVSRSIVSGRLTAVGIGGEKPIVPHGDLDERWRNRRVEFYLEK